LVWFGFVWGEKIKENSENKQAKECETKDIKKHLEAKKKKKK